MITTFYSYKGGVGRTSLAVETAARLALGGPDRPPLRVVLWDLDLEAPGVHHFPTISGLSSQAEAGTLDLLDLLWTPDGETVSMEQVDQLLLRSIVTDPDIAAGRLGVLAPNAGGALDRQRLVELDLPRLFSSFERAPSLLHTAARRMTASLPYDIVIVDARTGVSDLAATATIGLPDTLVFVLRMDDQDLANIQTLLGSIRRARDEGPTDSMHVVPVATFVPDPGDNVELATRLDLRRQELVSRVISPSSRRQGLTIEIPFRAASLLGESVPSLQGLTLPRHADNAYERLAEELHDIARPTADAPDGDTRAGRRSRPGTQRDHVAQLVAELLELDGWEIRREYDDPAIDLRINRSNTFGRPDVAVVQCKPTSGRLDARRLRAFEAHVTAERRETPLLRGLIVGQRGFTAEASRIAEAADLDTATPIQLLDALAPLDRARDAARRDWEHTELETRYVASLAQRIDPDTARPSVDDRPGTLDDRAITWLQATAGTGLLTILGEFGAGKSTFARSLAHRLATDDTGTLPVALLVDLKTVRPGFSGGHLLDYGLAWAGISESRHAAWRYRLQHTRSLVLIVDGFDEMLGHTDPHAMQEVIRGVLDLATVAPVVLTSRTNYFISHEQDLVQPDGTDDTRVSPGTKLWADLTRPASTEVLQVLPFTAEQVQEYLERMFPKRGRKIAHRLQNQRPLGEIATRPYLLKLVAGTVERWEKDGWPAAVNLTALYDAYVDTWQRERSDEQALVAGDSANIALAIVARKAWKTRGNALGLLELQDLVIEEILPALDLPFGAHSRVADELRTASFLTHKGDDRYSFVHSSFLEFFVARDVRAAIEGGVDAFMNAIDTRRFSPEVGGFLAGWPSERDGIQVMCQRVLGAPYRPQVSENALMLAIQADRSRTRGGPRPAKPCEQAHLRGAQLSAVDLSGVDLSSADLTDARLDGAALTAAILDRATLDRATLDGALLRRASAVGASMVETRAPGIRAVEIDLTGANMTRAILDGADLRNSILRAVDLRGAKMVGAKLDASDLTDARLDDADLRAASIRTDPPPALVEGARTAGARIGWPEPDAVGVHPVRLRGGHASPVRSVVCLSGPDGPLVFSADDDGLILVWDPIDGMLVRKLDDHWGAVNNLAVGSDGAARRLWSLKDQGRLDVWDPATGEVVDSMPTPPESAGVMAVTSNGICVLGGSRGQLRVAGPGARWREMAGHDGAVASLAAVAGSSSLIVSAGEDGAVKLWDAESGLQVNELRHFGEPLTAAAADGRYIAAAGVSGTLWITDIETATGRVLDEQSGAVAHLEIVSDEAGSLLACAREGGAVEVWDLDEHHPHRLVTSFGRHVGSVNGLAGVRGADGALLLVTGGDDRSLRVWDARTGQQLYMLRNLSSSLRSAHVFATPDGTACVAAAARDGQVSIWDAGTGVHRGTAPVSSATLNAVAQADTPEGVGLVTAGADGTVRLWSVEGALLQEFRGHARYVLSVASLRVDGEPMLVTGGIDAVVRLWNSRTGDLIQTFVGHTDWVRDIAVVGAPEWPVIASAADDGTIRLWDVASGAQRGQLDGHGSPVSLLTSFVADGTPLLASGGSDQTVRIWEPLTGRLRHELPGSGDWIRGLVAYPTANGMRLVTSCDDGTMEVWDPVQGELLSEFRNSSGPVSNLSVAVGPHGPVLASCGQDGMVRVLDPTTGSEVLLLAYLPSIGEPLTIRPGIPLHRARPGMPLVRGRAIAVDAAIVAGSFDGLEVRTVLPDAIDLVS